MLHKFDAESFGEKLQGELVQVCRSSGLSYSLNGLGRISENSSRLRMGQGLAIFFESSVSVRQWN